MKRYRSMKIKEIVQNQVIETQEELAKALEKEGIEVTQATVSRDIKEMRLVKVPYKNGRYRYALSAGNQKVISRNHISILFQEAVTKIDHTGNLVLIHTIPGSAQPIASAIDTSGMKHYMGTIAGDDTILIILRSAEEYPEFMKEVQDFFQI